MKMDEFESEEYLSDVLHAAVAQIQQRYNIPVSASFPPVKSATARH
jgi:hypothetical protein